MNFLSLIPKKVWFMIASVFAGIMIVGTAYHKGFEAGEDKQIIKQQELINQEVERVLAEAEKDLEEALELHQLKKQQVLTLKGHLSASERRSNELQEALNEILNNPPTSCDSLPDDYYRLRQRLYNKRPQD